MKKTLVTTLLALGMALSASAASLSDAQYTLANPGASTTLSDVTTDFSVTVTLSGTTLSKIAVGNHINSTVYTLFTVTTSGSKTMGVSTGYSSTDNIITSSGIFGDYGHAADNASGHGSYVTNYTNTGSVNGATGKNLANILGDLDFTTVDAMALTFTHDAGTASHVYLTIDYKEGETASYYGTLSGLKWSSGTGTPSTLNVNTDEITSAYVFSDILSQNDAIAMNEAAIAAMSTPNVPEPTTATLSLLALAGLCARRRRK